MSAPDSEVIFLAIQGISYIESGLSDLFSFCKSNDVVLLTI